MKNKILVAFIFLFFLTSCANQLLYDPDETLIAPTSFNVTPNTEGAFQVSYTVTNTELTFIGYNLYISESSIADADISSLTPYQEEGNIPSFLHFANEEGVTYNKTISIFFKSNDGFLIPMKFKKGATYYFRLCAYSRFDKQSVASLEKKLVAP